ncbi:hypothetical protein HDK64DRAFT_304266 [Phyllosticta capitalensis]
MSSPNQRTNPTLRTFHLLPTPSISPSSTFALHQSPPEGFTGLAPMSASESRDIRDRMSVNRIIMDDQDQSTHSATHEANPQLTKPQSSAQRTFVGSEVSRPDALREAAQALLFLAQDPRNGGEDREVKSPTAAPAQVLAPPAALPPTSHTRAQGISTSSGFVAIQGNVSRGKSKVKSKGISKKKVKAKKQRPMADITAGSSQHREFTCVFGNPCMLGQYTWELSRKMVSDYFGRNKKATALIEGRWIMSCRKHYQRHSYQESWPYNKADIIRQQLERIEDIEPGMHWQIKLKNSEEKRLTQYLKSCSNSGAAPDWTSPATTSIPDDKKQSSLAVLHGLSGFCGSNRSKQDCDNIITAAKAALDSGRATHFPLFEMVPQFSGLSKRKTPSSPTSSESAFGNEVSHEVRPRKKSKSSDEGDDYEAMDDVDDDIEDEDFVMEDVEDDSEGP